MANKLIYKNLILNDDESIIKVVRQRWLKLLTSLILPIICIVLPFFFLYPLFYWGNKGVVIFAGLLLTGILWLIRNIIVWYWQVFIITDQRIIDIDQKGLFQKTVSDIPLTKIDDVFYQIKGIWQTITRIGNIYVTLIDSKTKIEITNIAQPAKIQQLILQFKNEILKQNSDTGQLSAKDLVGLIAKIKAGIGEEKFNEILREGSDEKN